MVFSELVSNSSHLQSGLTKSAQCTGYGYGYVAQVCSTSYGFFVVVFWYFHNKKFTQACSSSSGF